jgi:hypothetical protein
LESVFIRNGQKVPIRPISRAPVDFNGNGRATDIAVPMDITNDSSIDTLQSQNDWQNIRYKTGSIGTSGANSVPVNPDDFTRDKLPEEVKTEELIRLGLYPDNMTPADTAALLARIHELETTARGDYTDASWAAFQSALSTGRAVAATSRVTQNSVDVALAELNSKFAALKHKEGPQAPVINGGSSVTLTYLGSAKLSVTGENLVWSGGNKSISVDQTGKVKSLRSFNKTGSATITASNEAGSVSFQVKVKPTAMQWLLIILLFGWIWF